ncbi:PREDICTED: prohormone-2-like [Nicrophorus vespilloides]|uniref:Prohormone-2-like n=1 Tax=Nicrophorus vespilloides TaxID=110193 RepID=A0ABM1MHQ8_NICVS|nr:PREDICTED: prohormone-2-like [Nicrophorus vespilloides]
MKHTLRALPFLLYFAALALALPASVVEDVKSSDIKNSKVKRAPVNAESHGESRPTAVKRGLNLKNGQLPLLTEWDQQRFRFPSEEEPFAASPLYTSEDELGNDKTVAEYEKGFRYGVNKDKLDEALENAILKSELYGEPAAVNQYRYYGMEGDKKRKRRNAQKTRMDNRYKREVDLSPEDILAILTLWENERQHGPPANFHPSWQRFDNFDMDSISGDKNEPEIEQNDEDWLDSPVYPHISEHLSPMNPNYYYDSKPQVYEKRRMWGEYPDKKKRFMVAKKSNDPTREIRFLNGPTRNNYYTLSELLGAAQQEQNVPLYQRYVL